MKWTLGKPKELIAKNIAANCLNLMLLLICCIYLISNSFAIYWADDFTLNAHIKDSSFCTGLYQLVSDNYLHWSGAYAAYLTDSLLIHPMQFGYFGLVAELSVGFILFIILFYFLGTKLLKTFLDDTSARIVIVSFLLFLLCTNFYSQVWMWLVGMIHYLVPLLFGFILLIYLQKKDISFFDYLIIAIASILVGGSTLQVSVLILSYEVAYITLKDLWKKKHIYYFLVWLFLAIILNIFAPGNFVRQSILVSDQSSILFTLWRTVQTVLLELYKLLFENFGIIYFIVVFYLFQNTRQTLRSSRIVYCILLSPFVSFFTVALGYGENAELQLLPTRVLFILDFAILISLAVVIAYLSMQIRLSQSRNKLLRTIMISALVIFPIASFVAQKNMAVLNQIIQIRNGNLSSFTHKMKEIYRDIQQSNEQKIEIYSDYENVYQYLPMMLSDDPNYWVNRGTAEFFCKDSIIVKKLN